MSNVESFVVGGGGGGGGPVLTLTGNSGPPVPATPAGNINIVGTGATTVVGNAGTNTLSITVTGEAIPWTDQPANTSVLANSGSFFTVSGVTLTLPAAPAQGSTCEFFVDVASITCAVTAPGGALIRSTSGINQATLTANVAGDAANTQGSSIKLVYRTVDTQWCVTSVNGTWV